jgi:hypothetical protein
VKPYLLVGAAGAMFPAGEDICALLDLDQQE